MQTAAIIILLIAVVVLAAKLTGTHDKLAQMKREYEDLTNSVGFSFEWRYWENSIEVIGRRWCGCFSREVVIKRYRSDDQAYAIRCAEELIEKLEEKI